MDSAYPGGQAISNLSLGCASQFRTSYLESSEPYKGSRRSSGAHLDNDCGGLNKKRIASQVLSSSTAKKLINALVGKGKDIPPIDGNEFISYARRLPTPTIYNAIRNAQRLTDITPMSFPESRWRHFAQVADFPSGLLSIGDAICRFNPVYGQGMTVAAQEANMLLDLLRTLERGSAATLAPTFLTKAEELIANPWAMSAVPDFIYPETIGQRPRDLDDLVNFQRAIGRLAARDVEIYELLLETRHLLRPLSLLHHPSIARRVKEEIANLPHGRDALVERLCSAYRLHYSCGTRAAKRANRKPQRL
jgi:hypothetical protein